jgi:hypothetical protein
MRNFITNNVQANRGNCQGRVNVFAVDTYARCILDCLRLLSSGLRGILLNDWSAHQRWQLVPSVVKPVGMTAGTGRRPDMQPFVQSMPARLG